MKPNYYKEIFEKENNRNEIILVEFTWLEKTVLLKKLLDRQKNSEFWHILTHFCFFDPLRVKISTLPPLCFMIYYILNKLKKYKKIEIPKQLLYPPFGPGP